jgi:hypothetical protein
MEIQAYKLVLRPHQWTQKIDWTMMSLQVLIVCGWVAKQN